MNPCNRNHFAHNSQPRPAAVVDCDHRATSGKTAQLKSLTQDNHNVAVFQFGTRAHDDMRWHNLHTRGSSRAHFSSSFRIRRSVTYRGRLSCVLSTGDRSQARPELADRLRKAQRQIRNFNEIIGNLRTELSVLSPASTASGSVFEISRSWPFPKKLKPTSRSRLGTTRAHAGAGLPTTLSLQQKLSAPFSPRS